jgi:hypothetical protein
MADRTPRSQETREATSRPQVWKQQGMLPTPEPRDGMHFRWVRTSSLGNTDMTNVSRRFREGYVPVKSTEFPELKIMSDVDSRFPDNIEVGGLLLCSIPAEQAALRVEGQARQAQAQLDAVDRNYMRESDPRMPVLAPERSTRTSFGKG